MRLITVVLVLLVSACIEEQLDSPERAPELRDAHCVWGDPPPVRCAYFDVPAKRSEPGAGTFSIFVTIIPALHADGRAPLVVLAGGPGGTGGPSEWLEHPARDHHDVVLMEQRGVGRSEPALYCAELEQDPGGASLDDPVRRAAQREMVAGCRERYEARGVDLSAFTTMESAADVDDLRRALGAEQINLQGESYGTRLALEVMRAFPERVRSAALFGTYPPQVEWMSDAAENGAAALRTVFEACAEDPDCPEPDLMPVFEQRMTELDAQPLELENEDGSSYAYTSADYGFELFDMMYAASRIPDVPGAALADLVAGSSDDQGESFAFDSATGLYLAITCSEDYPFADPQRAELAPFYMRYFRWDALPAVPQCEGWDAPEVPASFKEPVRSDVPALLVVGRFDPITPPRYSRLAAETLSRAQVVELPGASHDCQAGEPCVQAMFAAFLDDPSEPVDTECVQDELPVPDF